MGKQLSLGSQLRYPITITKLLKQSGDAIKKQDKILQYSFKWEKEVGDPFGETWKETISTIADWDSPVDGKITRWKVKEGMEIHSSISFVEVEEDCPHSVQFQGLCGMCGKDMTETSWSSATNDTGRATINMIHDQTALKVSQDEASKAEEELQRRLLKQRKLSLVVDLDQTIIHACIEPTVGEWQADKNSPNYEAVKDVRSFQLHDDGHRGVTSGCNYYIKMRPGLKEFLDKVSEMYELHVYTMGTRAYALNIAKIVDPEKRLFGDRIISRDENGSMLQKSLQRLFPVDQRMVLIIDDRSDVWPKNRSNLIKVHPYDFFLGIGDINSPFSPRREELPRLASSPRTTLARAADLEQSTETTAEDRVAEPIPAAENTGSEGRTGEATPASSARVGVLEELVRMAGGDQAIREEQAAEQAQVLEHQLTDKPLAHMQEQLEKQQAAEERETTEEADGAPVEHPPPKHNLLKDDDVELTYLQRHLAMVHKSFYEEYDSRLINAQGGRVAQLKPGHKKKVAIKDNAADLTIVPDVAVVMPRIKSRTLAGCIIVMSGLVPLGVDLLRSEIALQAISFGAQLHTKVSSKVTHLVASTSRTRTTKVKQAARREKIKIVNQQWLLNSMSKWQKEDEEPYLIHVSDADRNREPNEAGSSPPSEPHDTDDSEIDEESGSDEEAASLPASQEEIADLENVMPEEYEEGKSPVDNLQTFDWGGVDDELAEFMDGESDSDAGSDTGSETSQRSARSGDKRKYSANEDADEQDSDEESTLAKKQRIANNRTTGLKTVKTPNSEASSLPTPGDTVDGEQNKPSSQEDDDDVDFDDELERELMEELERGDAEDEAVAIANGEADGGG